MKKLYPISLALILVFVLVSFNFGQQSNAASTPKYFAYVANSGSNNVSAYSINPTTGALKELKGSPFPAGISPNSMTIHPTGKFLYVVNYQSHNISGYAINTTTGALTAIKGMPVTKKTPFLITIAPSGKFVYVATDTDSISVYKINIITGALSEIKGSPFIIDKGCTNLTFDPTGNSIFITNYKRNSVIVYSVNNTTGRLTKKNESLISSGDDPKSVNIEPSGKFAFIPNYDSQNFSVYSINNKTGKLSEIKGSPYGADHPTQATFALSGKVAYILNCETIDAYYFDPINTTLTEFKNNPLYHTMDSPSSFIIDQTKKFLYVTNSDSNKIAAFSIDSTTGSLTEIKGSPFKTGNVPISIVTIKQ